MARIVSVTGVETDILEIETRIGYLLITIKQHIGRPAAVPLSPPHVPISSLSISFNARLNLLSDGSGPSPS